MSELRDFTKTDWYGWAGAEIFGDGSPPMIFEHDIFTLIVDKTAISIYLTTEDLDDLLETGFRSELILPRESLKVIADVYVRELQRMGTREKIVDYLENSVKVGVFKIVG